MTNPDEHVTVQALHGDQPRPYSQADPSWALVAPARFFGGTGCWAHLADGSWDIVVPVKIEETSAGPVAVYGTTRKACRLPGR